MHTMRKLLVWLVGMGIVPALAQAQTWDTVLEDYTLMESVLQYNDTADALGSAEESTEQKDSLFPIDTAISDGRRQGNVHDSAHVVIVIDGYPVILTDVPNDEWYAPYVRDVAERGLISGYRNALGVPLGLYGPADSVTIEQLAKLAAEAARVDITSCAGGRKNVTADGRWSEQYIRCAEEKNWAVFSDGSVDVLRPATRAEVVVTILQAFGRTLNERKGSIYTDVDSSTEFGAAIETATDDKLVTGFTDSQGRSTGKFGPINPVNRAEAAKMFSLAFQLY